jgi:hypothetical protein
MASKSLLDTIGSDAKIVFKWFVSAQGQKIIHTGEAVAEAIDPGLTGIINIANGWMAEIIKTQTLATYAGMQSGSNDEKAAMTISAITPQIMAFAKQNGFPAPTADKIQKANDFLVGFLNALDGKA